MGFAAKLSIFKPSSSNGFKVAPTHQKMNLQENLRDDNVLVPHPDGPTTALFGHSLVPNGSMAQRVDGAME